MQEQKARAEKLEAERLRKEEELRLQKEKEQKERDQKREKLKEMIEARKRIVEGVKVEESQIREQLEKSGADLVQNKRTQKGLLKQQEQLARLCLMFNTLQQTTRHSK